MGQTKKRHLLFVWNSNLPRCHLISLIKFDNPPTGMMWGNLEIVLNKGYGPGTSWVESKDATHKSTMLRVPFNVQIQMPGEPTLKIQFEAMLGRIKHS